MEQLQRVEDHLLVLLSDTDHSAFAATPNRAPGLPDRCRASDALERVIGSAAFSECPDALTQARVANQVVGCAGGQGEWFLLRRDVDGDNGICPYEFRAEHRGQPDSSLADDQDRLAQLHAGRVAYGSDTSEYRTTQQ